jgi:membrane-associated phospholipid phosphatase
MIGWELASAIFFGYVAACALLVPGLASRRRWRVFVIAAAGLVVSLAATRLRLPPLLRDWVLPPLLLLVGYWSSGALFVAPMPRAERLLIRIDRMLRIERISAATPRLVAGFLEVMYVGVYPIIPVALVIHLLATPSPSARYFWTVVLVTDYLCFGTLPWLQTRPPRSLGARDPWSSSVRRFNLRLLGAASIRVNTFPSGHAAEALAAALLVSGAPWPWVAWMFFNAAAISAATVLGRYHYAADAVAGWAVALGVWLLLGRV